VKPGFFEKLNDTQKKIFYVMAVFVGLALLDRLCFGPMMESIRNSEDEISRQEEIIRRDLKFLGYSDRIVQNSQAFDKYLSQGPKDDDVVNSEFLSLIERLASQSKVNLVKSNPAEAKKEKIYSQYYANLDVSGQLKDMVGFMHLVNSNDQLLKVTRFNMSPKRGADGEVNASITVARLIVPKSDLNAPAKVKK
jgi:Tfp pilus assembly protein PilO